MARQSVQGAVLRYAFLPGIVPRLGSLFAAMFRSTAWYGGQVLAAVDLLPPNHPALDPRNFGRFGIFALMAAAANNLVLSWRNVDKIIVFICILATIALFVLQFFLFFFALFTSPAIAATVPIYDWFTIDDPSQKVDRILLDQIFGVPGLFDSCVSTAVACVDQYGGNNAVEPAFPYPFHIGLHALFGLYNGALGIVAGIVVLYFFVAATVETAVTGTPFGERFTHAWIPFRVAFAVALMIPTASGLSMGQIGVLNLAKIGGSLGTNAWITFDKALEKVYGDEAKSLIAMGDPPELGRLTQFMFTVRFCQIAQNTMHVGATGPIDAYLVRGVTAGLIGGGDNFLALEGTTYEQALEFSGKKSITIRFGIRDEKYFNETGFVEPTCGEIVIEPRDLQEVGAQGLYKAYYDIVKEMWADADIDAGARCLASRTLLHKPKGSCTPEPESTFTHGLVKRYADKIRAAAQAQRTAHMASLNGKMVQPEILDKGWAGSVIWFNRIAEMNGAVTGALFHVPAPTRMPLLMEEIASLRAAKLGPMSTGEQEGPFSPSGLGDVDPPVEIKHYPFPDWIQMAAAMNAAYSVFDKSGASHTSKRYNTGSTFLNALNAILGTSGIFDMRAHPDTNPLAQIVALGRSIIERSVRNFLIGIVAMGADTVISGVAGDGLGGMAKGITDFFFAFGFIGLVIGFILAYVTPFMPMIYFFVAVSRWLSGLFEAMVAIPLWAIAHLRVNGPGLPGKDASAGYMLLLELVLRPTLIIVGLLGSIVIFTSLVMVFHNTYDLILINMAGHDPDTHPVTPTNAAFYRGPIDEFFYTALYVIVVYMISVSAFKMIDEVPNQILRWMGLSLGTFSEGAGDPAGQLQQRIYSGTILVTGQAQSATGRLGVLSAALSVK